jgi:hypothetical protein
MRLGCIEMETVSGDEEVAQSRNEEQDCELSKQASLCSD